MKRDLEENLLVWKNRHNRKPLILRGARQVGKTYLIEHLLEKEFARFVKIDFEQTKEAAKCFETLVPEKIVARLEVLSGKKIIPGETLLFLDEIQVCPPAIMALRYFKEQMPNLHVIAAGSLLEFALNSPEFSMPVGRVEYLFLKPLSFMEFLTATGKDLIKDRLTSVTLSDPPDEVLHRKALESVREYTILGGMPAVIEEYNESKSWLNSQREQSTILNTYRDDFGKYAKDTQLKYLHALFDKTPGLIGENFQYSKIDPQADPRSIRVALEKLNYAGLIYQVHAVSANGLPLLLTKNEKKFKFYFLDIGLVHRAMRLDLELLLNEELMLLNRGSLAEQFVAQELLAYSDCHEPRQLYYWMREKKGSSAEVDFVIQEGTSIIPVEVKAGTTGWLRSLHLFMEEKKSRIAIRISQYPLDFQERILSVPLYLIGEIPRLLNQALGR
ncbi:MAG: DUF4143 domain-containing protein [Parachlamydia sp.]|nr:DUF4143 domain-containing protein [Parachlamydia sp.]